MDWASSGRMGPRAATTPTKSLIPYVVGPTSQRSVLVHPHAKRSEPRNGKTAYRERFAQGAISKSSKAPFPFRNLS